MAKARTAVSMAAAALLIAGMVQAGPADVGRRAAASVDPFIGTGGEGHTFPGAVVPFGMIQLSPDTQIQPRKEAYGWAAGYRYDDSTIVGFSHTHFSGTGHSDLGDVLLMPIAGEVKLERGDAGKPGSGYTSRFRHDDEVAPARLLRGDARGLRRARRTHRQRARRRASLHVPEGQAGARAGRPAHQHVRLPRQGAVVAAARCAPTAPSPASAKPAAGRRDGSCTSRCASRSRSAAHRSTTPRQDVAYKGFPPPGEKDPRQRAQIEGRQLVGAFDFGAAAARAAAGEGRRSRRSAKTARSPTSTPKCRAGTSTACAATPRRSGREALGAVDIDAPEPMRRSFYTALYHTLHGPEPVHGQRRPLPRSRQRRAPGRRASPTTRRSRCGTPTARCIRC